MASAAWATTSVLARPSQLTAGALERWRVALEQTARHDTDRQYWDRRYSDPRYWDQRYWDLRDQQRYDELRYWQQRSGDEGSSGKAPRHEARHDP